MPWAVWLAPPPATPEPSGPSACPPGSPVRPPPAPPCSRGPPFPAPPPPPATRIRSVGPKSPTRRSDAPPAGASSPVRPAAARAVAVPAGSGVLPSPGAAGDAGGAHRELEDLAGGDGQGGSGVSPEAAGGSGVGRVGGHVSGGAAALRAVQVHGHGAGSGRDGEGVGAGRGPVASGSGSGGGNTSGAAEGFGGGGRRGGWVEGACDEQGGACQDQDRYPHGAGCGHVSVLLPSRGIAEGEEVCSSRPCGAAAPRPRGLPLLSRDRTSSTQTGGTRTGDRVPPEF